MDRTVSVPGGADTGAVLLVGPAALSGRTAGGAAFDRPDRDLVAALLDFVDDDFALVGDEPIAVAELWRSVLGSMLRGVEAPLTLVVASSWPSPRVAAATAAVALMTRDVVVAGRAERLAAATAAPCVIEIAGDVVAVCRPGVEAALIDLQCRDDRQPPVIADAVARAAATATAGQQQAVVIDCPTDSAGAAALATMIATRLRSLGRAATVIAGDDLLLRAPDPTAGGETPCRRRQRLSSRSVLASRFVGAAVVAGAAAVGGAVIATHGDGGGGGDAGGPPGNALFVEGRVALQVPTPWTVQRITDGPGSQRVRLFAPTDDTAALYLTQAALPSGHGLAEVSATLRSAAAAAPAGVFDQFDDTARQGERAVIRYRENRPGRTINWTVLVDDAVRIGIGCPAPAPPPVQDACVVAIESARAVTPP